MTGRVRIAARAASASDPAWVALDGEAIAGFTAAHLFVPYELDAPVAELTARVVDETRRRGGVGRGLVAEFERWAGERGGVRVAVATAFHRGDAHAFYESLGYAQLARKYEKNPGADA